MFHINDLKTHTIIRYALLSESVFLYPIFQSSYFQALAGWKFTTVLHITSLHYSLRADDAVNRQ